MTYTVAITPESESQTTQTGTETEKLRLRVQVTAGASDTNIKLGSMTNPKYLVVLGAQDVTIKLDSTGTDSLGTNPCLYVSDDDDGLGIDEILVSNAGAGAADIVILAAE